MNVVETRSPRPISVAAATGVLVAAFFLRLYMWALAVDWRAAPTYTSLLYLGPFSLFLIWAAYSGKNWGRWLLVVLYIPTFLSWTRAMALSDYSKGENLFMGFLLALKAAGIGLLFVSSAKAWFRAGVAATNPGLH